MKITFASFFLLLLFAKTACGQHQVKANVSLNPEQKTLRIQETITYVNTSTDTLRTLYFNDWINSFRSKTTPLARRFAQDYLRRFHYAKKEERGHTEIYTAKDAQQDSLFWYRPPNRPDILKVDLKTPLGPQQSQKVILNYQVKIPSSKFTDYGYIHGEFKLRYWLILPSVYDQGWKIYSHKNLGDEFVSKTDVNLNLNLPKNYHVVSSLNKSNEKSTNIGKRVSLWGKDRVSVELYLIKNDFFKTINTDVANLITNIEDNDIRLEFKQTTIERIMHFLKGNLGNYPHKKMFITQEDYLNNPVYGLNQLPSFIRPYPDGFQYDIKLLKSISTAYLKNTLLLDPQKEKWVTDAIQVSLMMDYVDQYYPNIKLIGNFSEIIGLRWFHIADMKFNDQYAFLFMNMARLNLDQPLNTRQDSLVKFNQNIANPYKAGVGIKYLNDYLQDGSVKKSIKEFYQKYKLKPAHVSDFKTILKKNASKKIDWFFKDYVGSNSRIDFKIKKVKKSKDSLWVTIKNKEPNRLPVSLYGLKDKKVVSKYWTGPIEKDTTLRIPLNNIKRLALNYEAIIPEYNQRNNYKRVTTFLNKPIQFRLLQDVEDPRYNQLFLIPEFDYNLYDGFTLGPKLYNKNFLTKNFVFDIAPKYGFTSKALVGSISLYNTHQFKNQEFYALRYGFSGTRYSYARDLFYYKYSPFVTFGFRNNYLRNNEKQYVTLRSVSVQRDMVKNNPIDEPNYSVFNAHYSYSNRNLVDYFTSSFDYQVAKKFSKVSVTSKWRKLFLNNRQIELRFFAGAFLYNHTKNSNYFSFAIDRPTDYLFDYRYYGRSESSGLFSQQFIEAEGGFKSQLKPAFANQWLSSLNGSFTIWNWISGYGDLGLVKNKGIDPKFLYDSGVRVSLVQDYFELFFPVYSNLGWEIAQPNYDQKIRFIVSLDFGTLIKLFTREWY